jgi:hypothetical protein
MTEAERPIFAPGILFRLPQLREKSGLAMWNSSAKIAASVFPSRS